MDYTIIDGGDRMDPEDVARLLKTTYWADKRSREQIEASMRHSSCYGILLSGENRLAGFARVISDHATAYYLCDVVRYRRHRQRETASCNPDGTGCLYPMSIPLKTRA